MTPRGTILLGILGVAFLLFTLQQIRKERLYVGYGILWIIGILATLLVIAIPSVLAVVTRLIGARFPASALTFLALAFLVIIHIYTLTQITLLARRVTEIAQSIAIQNALQDVTAAPEQ